MRGKPIKKGQRLSPKTEFKKGQTPWSKTHVMSKETRLKMSEAKKGIIPWNKGKKRPPFSEEWRRKMGESHKGEKAHTWKGGITPINRKIRTSLDYKLWREAVFKRDDWTCVWCGQIGGQLNADHIKPFAYFPELRLAIDNGRTLCVPCHKTTDSYMKRIKI